MNKLLIVFALFALVVSTGQAATLTFPKAEISTWNVIVGPALSASFDPGGAFWEFDGTGNNSVSTETWIGKYPIGTPLDFSGYTEFGLTIHNADVIDWNYGLWFSFAAIPNTLHGVFGPPIAAGDTANVVIPFSTSQWVFKDFSAVNGYGFFQDFIPGQSVGGQIVTEDAFETQVGAFTAVPEPGTMILLSSGLFGLALWGRKRYRK